MFWDFVTSSLSRSTWWVCCLPVGRGLHPWLYSCGDSFLPVPVSFPFPSTAFPCLQLLSLKRGKIIIKLVSFQAWFDQLGSIISGSLGRGESKVVLPLFHLQSSLCFLICQFLKFITLTAYPCFVVISIFLPTF